jgi:hypothetical protein
MNTIEKIDALKADFPELEKKLSPMARRELYRATRSLNYLRGYLSDQESRQVDHSNSVAFPAPRRAQPSKSGAAHDHDDGSPSAPQS